MNRFVVFARLFSFVALAVSLSVSTFAQSNSSVNFGIRNSTRSLTGPTLTQVFGNGTTSAEGAIAFFAQIQRGILETNTTNYLGKSRAIATANTNTNRSFGCDYFGANASETFFRNRFGWYGKDQNGTNHIGRYDSTGAEGTGTIRMIRSAVITDDKPRLVLLRREDLGGGTFQFRVTTFTQDGTQEDGDTFTGTFVGNSSATTALTIGSHPGANTTLTNWWQGSISNVVFMRGVAGSDSDWQKVAKGQELSSVFNVANIPFYRRLQDTTDLSAVSGYTSDATSALTVNGSGYETGTALRSFFDGTSHIKIDEPKHGRVFKALKPGDTSANITITGTYEGSPSGVEVRLLKASDSSVVVNWTSGSASTGTWSVSLSSVPANWYFVEARFTNDTTVRHNCRNRVGVGWRPWVWGQSQSVIVVQETTTGSLAPTGNSVSHTLVRSQANFDYKVVTLFPQQAKDLADGAIALGNLLSTNYANVPIEVVWCNQSGTSVQEWTTDAVPSPSGLLKLGSEYAAKILAESNEISFFMWLQGTANAGDSAATYKGRMDSLLTGTGSPTWSFSGKFAGNLHLVVLGHCRHRDISNNPASGPGTSHQTMRIDSQYSYVSDVTSGITSKQFGSWLHDYIIDTAGDSTHQSQTDDRGNVRIGKRIAMAIARRAGLSDYSPLATLSSAQFGSSGKTTIELTPTLTNGGSLSAIVPATSPTAIDISTDSGTNWSNTGFTTSISGGKVILTKSSGDWTGVTVGNMRARYAYGWPAAIGNTQLVAETALTDGFLVETRSDTGDIGAPLMPVASLTISEPPASSAPTDITLSPTTIAENSAINTVVGALTSTDSDVGDTFTYSLVSGTGSTDNASFNISSANLRSSASFDYETKASYAIRIRSTDSFSNTYEKQFTITVTDVSEGGGGADIQVPGPVARSVGSPVVSPVGSRVGRGN